MKRTGDEERKREETNAYLSITLNVHGLHALNKRHRVAEWIFKKNPYICCLQETHFKSKDTHTESERMEKIIPCKWVKRKQG